MVNNIAALRLRNFQSSPTVLNLVNQHLDIFKIPTYNFMHSWIRASQKLSARFFFAFWHDVLVDEQCPSVGSSVIVGFLTDFQELKGVMIKIINVDILCL